MFLEVAADCPAEFNDLVLDPPELVVRYGNPVSVSCLSLSNYTDLNWIVTLGNVLDPKNQTWETDSLTNWEIQPVCYMMDDVQCNKTLPLTIYRPPDRVLISTVGHSLPMTEGKLYELQCDIENVAPVHLLSVNWYKGSNLVNTTNFTDISTTIPVNQSTRLKIFPSRDDEGVQYSCEAKLNLGPNGPQHPPKVTSDPLIIPKVDADCPAEFNDLVLDPPKLVVRYGNPASVSCRSLSSYTRLNWSVPLGNVLGPENQTVTWETDSLTDWEIQPVCYMILNDTQCSKRLPITVYKIPDQVSISIVNQTGPMAEGKKYDLQCDIQNFAPVNALAVFWYKGGKLLKNRGFLELPTKTPTNKTVTLKINASRDESEAQYSCEAKLKLGGSQTPLMVKSNLLKVAVHSKPVITCSGWSPMINTPLDDYPYNVTGNPSPNITWYRDKSPVSPSTRLSINDSGQYEYVATNVIGNASCVTEITVGYPPTFTCPTHHEGMEHESFLDKCSVMASPAASITWEKDGEIVNPLHNLTRGDNGSYLITAVNKHGSEKHHLTINVQYGPRIKPDNSSEVVEAGGDVSLSCTAEGNPEPEVRWSFQNHIKATGRRQTVLTISKAWLADAGVYTCTATNDLGNDTRTVSLTVESDCPIKIQPDKLVVEFGASVSANCSTTIAHKGIGWEASQGAVEVMTDVQFITWRVENLTHWDIRPVCYINVNTKQCELGPSVTVYKRPDRVSISTVNHTGPMIEGREYELQCDVQNVAPVHLLTVNWYKGQHLVKRESFSHETLFPADKTTTLQISPSKDDDGVPYRCEAELNLVPEGPQPLPKVTSDPLNITVHYVPRIKPDNTSDVVKAGGVVSLSCTAEGNPEPEPDKLVVEFGASASANCSTTIAHKGIGWEASQGAVDMKTDVQFITWRVENLTHCDIQPICFINANTTQCLLGPSITVYKRPDRVSISTVNHTGPMIEGREYELQCDVQNVAPVHYLTVNWYKGQHLVKTERFSHESRLPANKTTTLQISPSKYDDGVQYRCEAELNLGPEGPQTPPKVTSDPLNITVHYKPVITCSGWSPMINTPLDSYPYVMGNPSPTITWYRDKSPVSPSTRLSMNDSGQYEYVATNVIGSASCVTEITVEYPPTFTCPTHHEGMEHESFLDKCSVMASPAASITWEKDGKIVNPLHDLTRGDNGSYLITAVNKHGSEQHNLTINVLSKPVITCSGWSPMINTPLDSYPYNVTGNPSPTITWYRDKSPVSPSTRLSMNDSGQYEYVATNVIGSASCVPKITVEYPPTFTCPTHHEGMEHESLDKCSVMASPAASITWEKDGKIVKPLYNLTRGDSGSYLITAVNKHGSEKHHLTINVLYLPKISLDKPSQEVKLGHKVSLSCTAEGNPEPNVTWSFQNQTKTTGRRQTTLNIPEAKAADAGSYTCTANNQLGSDTKTATLTVRHTEESNLRTVIISVVLALLVLFIIAYVISMWLKHKRSGTYNIQANGAVSMSLLNQNDGTEH
ncbi:hypothetical protein AMELA_G00246430 [Ameiurus melas]|uniref:Ig-like domain-containing protein n=1 Tax=Ameiurus melas TaxID=219545 RepID=A0A7J5ZTC9_AMEME|nr:hypothetical protein AMELA_G00246430 [Ameiurus melas]